MRLLLIKYINYVHCALGIYRMHMIAAAVACSDILCFGTMYTFS